MRAVWSRRAGVVTLVMVLVAGACGGGSSPEAQDPRSPEARPYGPAAGQHPDVTLQPEVMIVEGGANAIRSVADGGLVWNLDPETPGADDLEVGGVMLVTGRGVGRVLDIGRVGDDLRVIVGPVELTDVIRDGTFGTTGISLDDPIEYPADDAFWTDPEELAADEIVGNAAAGPVPATLESPSEAETAAAATSTPSRAPAATVRGSGSVKPTVYATCCSDGVGVRFSYDTAGTHLSGQATLTFTKRPTAAFYLSISGSKVTRAELVIDGEIGVQVQFSAGTNGGPRDQKIVMPIGKEFSFPIA